jgi:hypothetical protein
MKKEAHSKNLFLISGYGFSFLPPLSCSVQCISSKLAFVDGYINKIRFPELQQTRLIFQPPGAG